MLFFDTETTGLLKPKVSDLNSQPEIIEFAAIKTNEKLEEIGRIDFLCRPLLLLTDEIPPEVSKVNNIYWKDVKNKNPFSYYLNDISDLFLGEEKIIAHNAPYDIGMLSLELRRLGMEFRFPWPRNHVCTLQMAKEVGNLGSKSLSNLYEHFFEEKIKKAHRAINDVEALIKVYKVLISL